jgi:zinc/manganese transport system substrate-binding protein
MRRLVTVLVAGLVVLGAVAERGHAAGKIRVVASLPDLKALTEAVGGDLVDVDVLARGDQNPHDIEIRPSLMVKLRRADLLIRNGVEGDPWVEPLLQGAGNGTLFRGQPGHVDASRGISVLGIPQGSVDRSRGDVHPDGNPHYTLDPANASTVTATILEALVRRAPEQRATFEAQRREFLGRLDAALTRWQAALAPSLGARVVTYHDTWVYFLNRFGLVSAGTVEDRPGIPPSPTHVAELIRTMRAQGVRAVVYEPWADRRLIERMAQDAGTRAIALAPAVGATKQATSYLDMFEFNVTALAQALR